MSSSFYVGAAAQLALSKRLDTIAYNISNSNTVGFRADGVKFDELVARPDAFVENATTSFPSVKREYVTTTQGAAQHTGSPLDLAIKGDAWFSLMTPGGQVFTRDGRLQITPSGEVQSVNGYSYLDASGAPLFADPTGGDLRISNDGMITQNGKQVGAIGLFTIDPNAKLTRYDNSSVTPDIPAAGVVDFIRNGVAQGYVEQSNVDPVREITRLIEVQRAFENISASMDMTDNMQQEAIRTLGSAS